MSKLDAIRASEAERDLGTLERRLKAVMQYVAKPGTNRIERADVVTAAHRIFKTGSLELLAAEKYRNLAEIAQGALEDSADRTSGGSSAHWSRTPATERQLIAMQQVRAAHDLTENYRGSRILPMVLVEGLKIADVARNLRIRKTNATNALRIILGVLAGADAKW